MRALPALLLLSWGAAAHELDAGAPGPSAAAGETTVRAPRPGVTATEGTVPADVLRAAPRTSAVDLVRAAPGVVATQHSGEGKALQLLLRGFDAVHGQDVELSVAGLPVNEPSHVHALGYADLSWLIPAAVRRVRVTEGAPRAAQGDFAVAGSIAFDLGLDEPGLSAAATLGSHGRRRLFVGVRPTEDVDTFAALELVGADGFGQRRAFERAAFLSQLVLPVGGAAVRVVLGSAGSRFDSPGALRDPPPDGAFAAASLGQGGQSQRHQALVAVDVPHAQARTQVEGWASFSGLALRSNFTGFLKDPAGDGVEQRNDDLGVGLRLGHHRHLHVLGLPLLLDGSVGLRHDDVTQAQQRYVEATGALGATDFRAKVAQTAPFAWAEAQLSPAPWRVSLGARVDGRLYDVREAGLPDRRAGGAHLALKAAVSRAVGQRVRLFASYGDAFRSAPARSLANGERAPFVDVRGAELGAAVSFRAVELTGAAFGTFVADDAFFDHATGTTSFTGPTWRGGLQATQALRPREDVVVSAHQTLAFALLEANGAWLPGVAPFVARVDAAWAPRFTLWHLPSSAHLGAALTVVGPRPLRFGDTAAAYALVDLKAALRVGPVGVVLEAQNALDARWRDGEYTYTSRWPADAPLSLLPARHFTAGAPRSLFVTLELHP